MYLPTYMYIPCIPGTSQDHPRTYSPPLPCLGIQGLPSISCTSLGSSQNILISPHPCSPVLVSRDSLESQAIPGIIPGLYSSLPPCPSILRFPRISGACTSRDYPRIVLISPPSPPTPPPPLPSKYGISGTSRLSQDCTHLSSSPPVQVSWDSLVSQVLPWRSHILHHTVCS